ncbi:atp-dependent metalloprotease family protein [Stylonychia lemnae]|uniref:Atp-dependent metalloprotease family protein n=1 Tax=Stylonychia lemnae TaxID=5949 RepID=A0A078AGD5_STYLE|nr:atp-dependent metalloprotease family protein [Stylonychia lemnae]|eukprot:CDW81299.1 atp-dependent metalloprotease family protein [Stylonychia lemnae]
MRSSGFQPRIVCDKIDCNFIDRIVSLLNRQEQAVLFTNKKDQQLRKCKTFTNCKRHLKVNLEICSQPMIYLELYDKYELASESPRYEQAEKVRHQYEFARDNLALSGIAMDGQVGDQKMNSQTFAQLILTSGIDLFFQMLFLGAIAMGMMMVFRNFDSKSLLDNYKFDTKKAKDISQRLDDVKGIDEIKEEVENLIKMIREPEKYTSKGAKLHKGVLLYGRPGTGKTLLARAIAGEAGTSFIYCTGSHFDEMFVGVGAKRVRELFQEAKSNKPCIIFIDEIDTLLSKSRRFNSEHSSSRATINQLLAEMDGFEKNDQIMVIGATNHEEILDPAAVRPGRFDKKIHVPLPDINGRENIFDLYLNRIAKAVDVESRKLAQMTPGFTGAEIENLVNTAITEALHKYKEMADMSDFEYARDRIMMGIERKKLSMTDKDRLNTAIHEAGHAIACYFTPGAKKLYKATIVARGGSLGATFMVPDESDMLSTNKEKVLANIDVAMGGHIAEKLYLGGEQITTGCGSDLKNATDIAYEAVRKYGMFGAEAGLMSTDSKEVSQEQNAIIDDKVKKILDESYERVTKLLQKKDKELRELSKGLFHYDYLDHDEIEKVINGKKIEKEKVRSWDYKTYGDYAIRF